MADVRGGCLKAVAWAIGGLLALIVLAFVFFSIFPPFGSTETGYLSRREEARITLAGTGSSATHELRVGAGSGVYSSGGRRFEPLTVRVAARTDGGAPLAVLVLPADGMPIASLTADTEAGTAAWTLDCQRPTDEQPCPRDYLLVVTAPGAPASGVDGVLEVFAEQRFPYSVGTPFGVGLEVDVERRADLDATRWTVAATTGTLDVSPTAPVAGATIEAPGMRSSGTGGLVLVASAVRDGPAAPTGLEAPPPVRVALLDATGSVMAELGVRPGTPSAVAVPPGSGRHRLVAWWQDRGDHAYAVTWHLTAAIASAGELTLSATDEPTRGPIGTPTTAAGVHALGGAATPGEESELPLAADIGFHDDDRLAPMTSVLRLRLMVDEAVSEPVVLRISPVRTATSPTSDWMSIVLEPGVPREIVLDGLPGCPAGLCDTWALLPAEPGDGSTPASGETVLVRWQASLQLWPLDPFGIAAR